MVESCVGPFACWLTSFSHVCPSSDKNRAVAGTGTVSTALPGLARLVIGVFDGTYVNWMRYTLPSATRPSGNLPTSLGLSGVKLTVTSVFGGLAGNAPSGKLSNT